MTDVPRVVMVIQRFRPAFSGQGIQVEAIAKALARRGADVSIVTATSGTQRSIEVCDGYSVVRVGCDPPSLASPTEHSRPSGPMFAARTFGYLQTAGRCDLVHVHAMTDALYASYAWCRLHDKPLLFEMTLVGADDPLTVRRSANRFAGARQRVFYSCDGYVAISPALQTISREAGLPSDRVKLIPQGVDIDTFAPVDDRMSIRRDLGLPADGPLLAFVGSLVHRKGLDVLLDAWSVIHRAHPKTRLLLVGRDNFVGHESDAAFLSDQLARVPAAAAERIHRTGVQDDVHRYLQASDLFVFPSRREGFGTVMVEAMATGLPCVVCEQPGVTDFIFRDGATGVVVGQEDPRALADAVNSLLENGAAAAEMGRVARREAVDRFDINAIADRYIEYYRALVAGVGKRGVA